MPVGATVRLSDFAGRVVFLEWFAVWCPYCVAAALQVETGMVDWYAARGGNPYGVPVLHIAVNQEPRSCCVQGSTNLIDWTTLRTVTGSTNAIVFRDTNAPPARRFYRAVTP